LVSRMVELVDHPIAWRDERRAHYGTRDDREGWRRFFRAKREMDQRLYLFHESLDFELEDTPFGWGEPTYRESIIQAADGNINEAVHLSSMEAEEAYQWIDIKNRFDQRKRKFKERLKQQEEDG